MSKNYGFVIAKLSQLYPREQRAGVRVLDFGCGGGEIVEHGLAAGFDFYGADPYQASPQMLDAVRKRQHDLQQRIGRIENDRLPFEDGWFDVVVSNQVFEHVADLDAALGEVRRVLKPGGLFLSLFPTYNTWWEGHCRLFFAHWLSPRSRAAYLYYRTLRALGFGTKKDLTPHQWAVCFQEYLSKGCFYRSDAVVVDHWRAYFGRPPESWESELMVYRLETSRLRSLASVLNNRVGERLLAAVCRIRAGRVLATYNG